MPVNQINKYVEFVPKLIFEHEFFPKCTNVKEVCPVRDTRYGFTLDWELHYYYYFSYSQICFLSCTRSGTCGKLKYYSLNEGSKHLVEQKGWKAADDFPLYFHISFDEIRFITIEIEYDTDFNIQKHLSTLIQIIEDNLSDVTFVLGDQNFKASKAILAARSPVFAKMFKTDMLEKKQNIIEIHGDDPRAFKEMLEVIYTGPCQHYVADNAKDWLILADKYQIEDLQIESARILEHSLSINNVIDLLVFAIQYNSKNLKAAAVQFFGQRKKEIFLNDEYKQIYDLKDFQLIDELFRAIP